jgi:hypothetical protein
MRQQAEIITATAAVPPCQAASDHADQIAVDFRRGNSSPDLDIHQARRPRAPEQGLQNLDGVDAVTGGLTSQINILRNDSCSI